MSLKRLTIDERATYLAGLAVRQQFEEAPRDPDTVREITHVASMIERIAVQVRVEKCGAGRSEIRVSGGNGATWSRAGLTNLDSSISGFSA